MWNNPPEIEEYPRSSGIALWVTLFLFLVILLSNLFMLRPRVVDRVDTWSTKVLQADFSARMLYGDMLPFGAVRGAQWDDVVKLLTARDAPLGALVRAVILLHEQESIIGQQAARVRIRQLLQRMPAAPTQFSPEQRKAVQRWCETVYGRRGALSSQDAEQFRRTIESSHLGWMRLLALKHLEFLAGNTEAARRWDVEARQQANHLQQILIGVFFVVVILLLGGLMLWLAYAIWKSSMRSTQPALPVLPARHADTVLWALAIYFAAIYFGGWIGGFFARSLSSSTSLLVVLILLVQVTTGGIAVWFLHLFLKGAGIGWRDLGFTWKPLAAHIAWGTGAYVATVPVLLVTVVLVQVLLPTIPTPAHPIAGVASSENPWWVTVLLFLVAGVFAPLFEEIFFRGVLLNALWARTGNKWAGILVSALVFSVLHPQLYLGWVAVFVIGVMLGALFVERRALTPCIWMHALNNTLALAAAQMLRMAG